MSLPPAQLPASESHAALGEDEGRNKKHPRHAFIAWLESHPAREVARPDFEFVAELMAHPVYCLASQTSVQRWELMLRCRSPSRAHAQQWHVYDIDVGLKQRSTLLARAALSEVLVRKLVGFRGACSVGRLLHHATCVVSRCHFLGLKNQAARLFHEGRRLYGEQRFSEAARSWGQAALLQHGASHAFLSTMLIDGRPDVAKDEKRGFELAAAGAAMGCAHSKGALGRCLIFPVGGFDFAEDRRKGQALGLESAAAGSCFGQFVVGMCNHYDFGLGIAQDYAEAARLWHLAAAQGHAVAQINLGMMFCFGKGVAQDRDEGIRWCRLAEAQGLAGATVFLKSIGAYCT